MTSEEAVLYYDEHSSELNKQMHELGFTPHDIIQDAFKEGISYKEYIVLFLN